MRIKVTGMISATALCVAFAIYVPGQVMPEQKPPANPPATPPVSPCPKLEVHPAIQGAVKDGRPIKFTATLTGGDSKVTPIFIWTTTAGAITAGQGTANIDVDSTGAGADKAITASILIGGFPGECAADANTTVPVIPPAKKFDEYGVIKDQEETAKLESFTTSVTVGDQAFIIAYAGRTSPRGQAGVELRRIKAYILKLGIQPDHIATIDGGYREEIAHELWLVPIGADAPRPSPTIAAKDIVFPKPTPPVKKP